MGHKTTEIICNINKAFGPWTANECTVQGWFKKFCKGGESLKDEEHSDWPSKIDTDQLRAVIEAGLLATTQEVAQELNVDHSMDIWHLKERWKNLISGCLMSWLKIKKKTSFGCAVFSYSMGQQQTIFWSICGMGQKVDFIQQPAQWLDWEEAPKHFIKPNLQQKEVMVTVWWPAACLIHYSLLNSGQTITSEKHAQQIDQIPWKLQSLQPALVNRMGPILHDTVWPHVTQPILQKLNELVMKFCPICHIHLTVCQLTTTSSSILTTFFFLVIKNVHFIKNIIQQRKQRQSQSLVHFGHTGEVAGLVSKAFPPLPYL